LQVNPAAERRCTEGGKNFLQTSHKEILDGSVRV
jgi:hypothetical protein